MIFTSGICYSVRNKFVQSKVRSEFMMNRFKEHNHNNKVHRLKFFLTHTQSIP